MTGLITGFGGVIKSGFGVLTLGGTLANTYQSNTIVRAGTLELNKSSSNAIPAGLDVGNLSTATVKYLAANQINDTNRLVIGPVGDVNMNHFSDTVGSIEGSGSIALGVATLTVGQNNLSTAFSGSISGNASAGTPQLVKTGTGALTLSASSTFTGDTSVQGGQWLQNGTQPGKVNIYPGGLLGGSGTVGQVACLGGQINPGNSPGKLNTGSLSADANSVVTFDLGGLVAGTNYDQLNVSGTVALNGALALNCNFPSSLSNQFTLIRNDGVDAIAGTFNNLSEGTVFTAHSRKFKISYVGGDGNDVVLTQVSPILPPLLSSITVNSNGAAQLNGTGLAGTTYSVEWSSNLVAWSLLAAPLADTNGLFQVSDAVLGKAPQRFFRVVAP
jgi:autotransporter-associated beta strand protein